MANKDVNVNIKTKADTSGLDKTAKAIDNVEKEAKEAEGWADRLANKLKGLGDKVPGETRIGGFFQGITKGASGAVLKIGAVTAALTGLFKLVKTGIGNVSLAEDIEASLTTLLGSAEAAQKRLKEIQDFAAETPLSIGGLATASRQLETLTGGAMGAADSLRLIGNAAAIAQRPGESLDMTIQNVALHVGRLNAALTSGQGTIGESVMRMQELGLMAPELAFELRKLHEEGGRGAEAWGILEASLKRFDGEMERRSKTISGKTSTLADSWRMLTAAVSKPLAPLVKASLSAATVTLNGLRVAIEGVTSAFGLIPRLAQKAGDSMAKAADTATSATADLNAAIADGAERAAETVDNLAASYDRVDARVAQSIKRQQALNKARLNLRLLEIETDDSLSEVAKAQKSGAARKAAGERSRKIEEKAVEGRISRVERERAAQVSAIGASEQEANRLTNEIEKLRKALEVLGPARQANVARINKDIEKIDQLLASIPFGLKDDPLTAGTVSRAARKRRGELIGEREDIKRSVAPSIRDPEKRASAEAELAALQEAKAAEMARANELQSALANSQVQYQRELQGLRDELFFVREMANIQRQAESIKTQQGEARARESLSNADFTTRAAAAEPISAAALGGSTAAAELKRTREGLEQTRSAAAALAQTVDGLDGLPIILGNVANQLSALKAGLDRVGEQVKNNRK